MNTHELIESTMLHALGLLDDSEREAYEAAFASAPQAIQLRVREEARRMADLGDLFPEHEPDMELRTMVLSAVRAAMREEQNEARIAQTTAAAAAVAPLHPAGNASGNASANGVIAKIDANTTPQRATSQPKLSSSPRVNQLWRVAAIGFAAASIAIGTITVNMQQTFKMVQSRALVTNLYDTIGAQYLESTIFDESTQRVALTAQGQNQTSAVAAVWTNPDWATGRLFVKNLAGESNEPFRLVVLDSEGNIVREIATFAPTGEFQDFDVDVNLATERNLAIYPALIEDIQSAAPVLTSSQGSL
tara:strand:- start:116311 stop:117222 length:912 start_codon:yes stop_codon:yes gene_type:complete